tara:strand:- start:54 stop:1010 length:957 start_codon:yes stop_codon:yes gene_type:complete
MKRFLLLAIIIFISHIDSHEFNPAHLIVNEVDTNLNEYEITWMYPYKNIGQRGIVVFPEFCNSDINDPYIEGKYLVDNYLITCEESLRGASIEFYNLSVLTDALITINFYDQDIFESLVNNKNNIVKVPLNNNYLPIAYLNLGISHLFTGIDHILFILGLIFLVKGALNIVKTITAFTIAHSITLAFSVLGYLSLPQSTVEALIALTIIYLAIEIISKKKRLTFTPWSLAFGFGLLHGMGFAGVLREIGIGEGQIIPSLLFFNIGIEVGQLMLIPVFIFIIYFGKKYNFYNYFVNTASFFLGIMGFYWFIDRSIEILI